MRSPQNQNLSKMREVLKYGIFDISSMSTKGFWLTYVKTSFFVYFWDKNAIFSANFFCPLLDISVSGSPIIQDGKLVGAVTHVLVNDPTRGYGIFIENMLEAAK